MSEKVTVPATLSELLDEALALPPDQRLAWVEGLASRLEGFKPRLRALLARSLAVGTSAKLETLPSVAAAPDAEPTSGTGEALSIGATVGRYQLERRLGAGAMGVVWLAQARDDAEPRRVALKFAHMAERRPDLPLRLARERGLLAALDHPNIARLHDAGLTAEGQPYLVLEYVEGEALDVYCARQAPDLRRRLKLFVQVADAVAHAHARQIVHRDLKPANVLVTPNGHARLLDFGVGSLLEGGAAQGALLSAIAGRPVTLAYAAPEQLVGEPGSFASDVYSLGVILYELLTGVHPHAESTGSTRALREAILFTPPRLPSARTEDPEHERTLRSALDPIAMRALSKRAAQRQPSARTLSLQIVHALAGM